MCAVSRIPLYGESPTVHDLTAAAAGDISKMPAQPTEVDVPVDILTGLVTDIVPATLPHGASPDCQDVQFQIGSAKTRPGITALYTLPGNPTVNYEKTYETALEVPRFMSLDSLGILRDDVAPGGALQVISSQILPGSYARSTTLFNREFFGLGKGISGYDTPRQFDDTYFDRISSEGPGQAPAVADESATYTTENSPNGLT